MERWFLDFLSINADCANCSQIAPACHAWRWRAGADNSQIFACHLRVICELSAFIDKDCSFL